MKQLIIASFLLASLLFTTSTFSQIQNYYVDTTLDEDGKALVKLDITFSEQVKDINFFVLGRVENFQATANARPLNCSIKVNGITNIGCDFSSVQNLRMTKINFTTPDFVKVLDNKFYFNGDFTLNQNINSASVFIRIPEGMIVDENATKLIFPENSTMVSDGRRIIVVWNLNDIKANEPLKFQILYQRISVPPLFQIRLRHFAVLGIAIAVVSGFIYIRYFRKPQKLILSVLDDYERKVMNLIIASEGLIDQKKVVKETNLSKAKISRVVKSLVERGLIEVERMGRRNKLKLVKKKFRI